MPTDKTPMFEDAYEQMFYDSIAIQMEIAKDAKNSPEIRLKAADEAQKAYLTKQVADHHHNDSQNTHRTASKAIDAINRLKRGEEE